VRLCPLFNRLQPCPLFNRLQPCPLFNRLQPCPLFDRLQPCPLFDRLLLKLLLQLYPPIQRSLYSLPQSGV
jgi:hypothetical protein